MNPARPAAGHRLCRVEDLADPGSKSFAFRSGEALFIGLAVRIDGEVKGYVDRCPHAGSPLGTLDGRHFARDSRHLICIAHGALFEPDTGLCVAGPGPGTRLAPWPLTVRDGWIETL